MQSILQRPFLRRALEDNWRVLWSARGLALAPAFAFALAFTLAFALSSSECIDLLLGPFLLTSSNRGNALLLVNLAQLDPGLPCAASVSSFFDLA